LKFDGIDRIGDHRNSARGDAARLDLLPKSAADRGDVIGMAERECFESPRCAVSQAAFGRRPVVDRGVLPECAKLVDDGNAETASDSQRRQRIQHWGMCVEDIRAECRGQFLDAAAGGCHFLQENDARRLREPVRPHRSAVKLPAIDVLDLGRGAAMPRRRELQRFPPPRPLFTQDGESPKRVAAVRRKRVIEDVENAHGAVMRPRGAARRRQTRPRRCAGRHRT
jgi:hypothetical protein